MDKEVRRVSITLKRSDIKTQQPSNGSITRLIAKGYGPVVMSSLERTTYIIRWED